MSSGRDNVALPIDPLLPEIVRAVRASSALVLEAPPGAGKTTRVPRALVESGALGDREVLVLQPRRLPTRLAARRVAEELGEEVGRTVGYQMRFEDVGSRATRLRFLTEGVLTRRLLSEPTLPGVGAVVLDEFHERHLATDLALALLRRLQQTERKDLKLLVMSATLEAAPVAAFLGECPSLRSEGRRFEVALEHLPAADERPLEQQVLAGVKRVLAAGMEGDLLVFLPGAAEIRRAREACEELAGRHGMEIHALHGDLPPAEQDRAVRPGRQRKIILSTNVAETSVTIEGVGVVIDSGLARVASHSPWSGLPVLQLGKVSKASATQRAGRAGRTREGHCLRLYTRHDFESRKDHDVPEIRRMDLAEAALAIRASGVRDVGAFPFFEPPPPQALEAADSLLKGLGAVAADGALTEIGRRLLAFPVHPRQARVVVEAERRGVGQEGAAIAALLGERDIRREARSRVGGGPGMRPTGGSSGPSDLLELRELLQQAEAGGADRARSLGLEPAAVAAAQRVQKQLARLVRRGEAPRPSRPEDLEQALLLSVLAGYPDRVARRRKPNAPEVVLSGGGSAALSELSVVREPELLVAVDVEERPGQRGTQVLVRLASAVEPEWLLELFPERIREAVEVQWNASLGRADRLTRLFYDALVLEETRAAAPPSPEAARLVAEALLAKARSDPEEQEALAGWLRRLELVAGAFPSAGLPSFDEAAIRDGVAALCEGVTSLEELGRGSLAGVLQDRLPGEQQRLLAVKVPERVTLAGGRQVRVHYEAGKPPWIESRLQDFFGSAAGPAICDGRVPLVIHLLAPNQRAVQVTQDLSGFWDRHYPAIRRELMRKYPKHAWPEDPRTAKPPAPGGRRRE
ncbi:MAG TPA: ATP-dependent helicase HrpB [Myxococcales bacterium]|nr:ATP-dependent helicase HrpB [Myxococcales bacterium]